MTFVLPLLRSVYEPTFLRRLSVTSVAVRGAAPVTSVRRCFATAVAGICQQLTTVCALIYRQRRHLPLTSPLAVADVHLPSTAIFAGATYRRRGHRATVVDILCRRSTTFNFRR